MCKGGISKATLSRIPTYLELLKSLPEERYEHISATAIARKLSLGEVQVRKDLASISGAGKPKLGYVTSELIENLEDCLGQDCLTLAVLVGAGKLGKALLDYALCVGKQRKAKAIRLDAYEANIPAIRLYEKCGFTYMGLVDLGLEEIYGLKWYKVFEKVLLSD